MGDRKRKNIKQIGGIKMINGFPFIIIVFLAGMICGALIEFILYLFSCLLEVNLKEKWEDKNEKL